MSFLKIQKKWNGGVEKLKQFFLKKNKSFKFEKKLYFENF